MTTMPEGYLYELAPHNLTAAAHDLFLPFGRPAALPLSDFLRRAEEFYATMELDERGQPWNQFDRHLICSSIRRADSIIALNTTPADRTRRLLVIGCGNGRLAEEYLKTAIALGFVEVTFNDLFDFHVAHTRDYVETLTDLKGRILVTYHVGDFTQAQVAGKYDIAACMFYVTSEILDPSCVRALRNRRHRFYRHIRDVLIPNGMFIEDIPEAMLPGFYLNLRKNSQAVLTKLGVLVDEAANLSLTCLDKKNGGYPFHLRYIPSQSSHMSEMRSAGFFPVAEQNAWIDSVTGQGALGDPIIGNAAPPPCDSAAIRIKKLHLWTPTSY